MTATVNANTTTGVVVTSDTSGALALQTGGTTALTISSAQAVSLTNALPVASGGTGVTTSTGTGNVVLSTSPTIATPTMTGQATIPTINLTGGQIAFPASISASTNPNTLDDYEEGIWTPVPNNITINSGSPTYIGRYTKIGNMVYLDWRASGGNLTIQAAGSWLSGLPFTCSATYPSSGTYVNGSTNVSGGLFQMAEGTTTMYCCTTITTSIFVGSIAYAI